MSREFVIMGKESQEMRYVVSSPKNIKNFKTSFFFLYRDYKIVFLIGVDSIVKI